MDFSSFRTFLPLRRQDGVRERDRERLGVKYDYVASNIKRQCGMPVSALDSYVGG